jgi:hypothetical protein
MTPDEQLIQRYFDAFNGHDLEGDYHRPLSAKAA